MSDEKNAFEHGKNILFAFRFTQYVTKYVYNSRPAYNNMLAYAYSTMTYNLVVKL